jgi:very-short-patch-repair endonuclease
MDRLKNNIELKFSRKKLRNNATSAEAELWKYIKGKKLDGRKFRRQFSVGSYILDFYCPSENLCVELDGDPHGDYIQIEKDNLRDEYLKKSGIKVLRFENRFVFQTPEFVLETIKSAFKK